MWWCLCLAISSSVRCVYLCVLVSVLALSLLFTPAFSCSVLVFPFTFSLALVPLRSCVLLLLLFFFYQKTAYDGLISDWSSDVCSSDLNSLDAVGTLVSIADDSTPRTHNATSTRLRPPRLAAYIARSASRINAASISSGSAAATAFVSSMASPTLTWIRPTTPHDCPSSPTTAPPTRPAPPPARPPTV